MKTYIIFSDCHLTLNINCLLSQVVDVFDCVCKWYDKVETWLQLTMKLSKSVNHDCVFFWNNDCKSEEVSIFFTDSL